MTLYMKSFFFIRHFCHDIVQVWGQTTIFPTFLRIKWFTIMKKSLLTTQNVVIAYGYRMVHFDSTQAPAVKATETRI